ncbi:MAG TPA: hypothetical protein VI731_07240 [Bacteroidia bacterium]|nr:hypothetical protein [Bacteroidia bacterium]
MRAPLLLALLFFIFLAAACSSDKPEMPDKIISQYTGILPKVMENDSGIYHGILLGMTPEEVKQSVSEKDSLGQEEKNYLQFEGFLAPFKEYSYDCNFDEKGLKDVTIDIFLHDEQTGDSLYEQFMSYFTQRYGPPVETLPLLIWETSEGKRPAKIILEDETPQYMYGKLTITFVDKSFDPKPPTPDSMLLK